MTTEITDPLPEQTFFEDPALDRAFGVVMALATETYVLRDRLRAMERLLEQNNLIEPGQLDLEPSNSERAETARDRQAFVEGLMVSLLGRQQAKGAGGGHG